MDSDLFMVIGVCLVVVSAASLIGAFSEGRPPRAAAVTLVLAGGLIALAIAERPSGYSFQDVPHAFSRVIARLVN